MKMTLPKDAKNDLIAKMKHFAESPKGKSKYFTKRDWQRLTGWVNWGLNIFLLLTPCLANIYAKLNAVRDCPHARIWSNKAIRADLLWSIAHMEQSNGTWILKSMAWNEVEADFIIESDACFTGLAFWYPHTCWAFYAPAPLEVPQDLIFFLEALTVASAFSFIVASARHPLKIIIYINNSNMVAMFNSMHTLPRYNKLLKHVVDYIIEGDHDLKVRFIPGEQNHITDLVSRHKFAEAHHMFPSLKIESFQPP